MAAQHKIKAIGEAIQRYGGMGVEFGNQRANRLVVINGFDDRTLFN